MKTAFAKLRRGVGVAVAVTTVLTACGQSGALHLPDDDARREEAARNAADTATDAATDAARGAVNAIN